MNIRHEFSSHSNPRRQHTGAAALERALDEGIPLRLVLVSRGAVTSERIARLLPRLVEAGVEVRETSANDLRRMRATDASGIRLHLEDPKSIGASGSAEPGVALGLTGNPAALILGFSGPDPKAPPELWMTDTPKPAWLLTGVSYPGNAGYAIRCAEVSGAAGIALDVDYDRSGRLKALRASMGAHRFLPVLWGPGEEVAALARAAGRRVVVIEDCGDTAPWDCELTRPSLFVVGGEERGVPRELIQGADAVLRIPVAGFVPSYNLQAAMAMVAAEFLRQAGAKGVSQAGAKGVSQAGAERLSQADH